MKKFKLIASDFKAEGFGSDEEPFATRWMTALANGIGSHFRENIKLLDYGCGGGRFANFMSERLLNFFYYGLEPKGSLNHLNESCIGIAQKFFGHDPRVKLGNIGTDLEKEAIQTVDVALLGSIFTHLDIESSLTILDKLLPIISREGVIVFSVILKPKYRLVQKGVHNLPNCYGLVENTTDQFENYFKNRKLNATITGVFHTADHRVNHTIYRIEGYNA